MAYKRKVEIFEEAYTKKGEKSTLSYDGRDGKKRYIAGSSDPDVEPGGGGGTGIESIEQTVTSEESGGVNVITVTTSDGATTDFQVRNGMRGATGPKGDQGNSGYSGAAGELKVVNNLYEGGEESALTAEMGKFIKENVQTIFDALGEFAFPNGKPEISWGDTPTPPTPPTPTAYDAEIEYLESDGNSWIDTLENLQTACSTYIKMSITKAISSNAMVFGAWMDGNNSITPKAQIYIDASQQWAYSRTANIGVTGITSGAAVSLNTIYELTATTQAQTNDLKAYLFARNNEGGAFLPIDGMRLYGCTMTKDNVLVRDFIPVRVGQVGYLYDRVSGELFGNAGSGNFILGNDKNA